MGTKPIDADLKGRVCVVTGANAGMGRETARELARMGATVVMACRSAERGAAARDEIAREVPGAKLELMSLDLASLASVRKFAAELAARHPAVDVLVNNAGAWWIERQVSADGFELQWATNVLGPFLLTQLVLPLLEASGRGRVVNVASDAARGLDLSDTQYERRKYSGFFQYSATKQANRMLSWALAKRLAGRPVTVNALNPGLVKSELNRSVNTFFRVFFALSSPFAKPTREGADTAVWLAASPEVEGVTDRYWDSRREKKCQFRAPERAVDELWSLCAQQAGLA